MITNVPTAEDFAEHGLMFLNLAWTAVFDLIFEDPESDEETAVGIKELNESYWAAAKRPLSVAHALAQQGAELALKSQVASTSPFLLLSDAPADWPRGCDKTNTPFADFYVVGAQELVRACNAVRESPLPEGLIETFEKFRKQRNALFHTVDERLDFSHEEIVRYILRISELLKPGRWPQIRKAYLEQEPIFKAYAIDDVVNTLCAEMSHVVDMLGRAELLEFFGFNKKQRRYICPRCYWALNRDYDPPYPMTAQLHPNAPSSTGLYCFVCDNIIPIHRRDCREPDCKGNVINMEDDGECLTCFESQGEA